VGPFFSSAQKPWHKPGPRHLEPLSATRHKRTDWTETVGCLQRPPFITPGEERCAIWHHALSHQPPQALLSRGVADLHGWANYFDVGTVSTAYRAIDNYIAVWLRRRLCFKRKVRRRKDGTYHKAMRLGDCPSRIAASSWRRQNSPFGLLALI
jgi:hypothetical protein